MAPEIINSCNDSTTGSNVPAEKSRTKPVERGYSFGVDIFAYGMLLFEMMTLSYPYNDVPRHEVADAVRMIWLALQLDCIRYLTQLSDS